MRHRFLALVSLAAVACGGARAPESQQVEEAGVATTASDALSASREVRDALAQFAPFAAHLGRGGILRRAEGGYAVVQPSPTTSAPAWKEAAAADMIATLPARIGDPLRFGTKDGALSATLRAEDLGDAATTALEGAVIARPTPAL